MRASGQVPHLAQPNGYRGPRRSLILSGGGLRLAYQAGVLRALSEAELVFSHFDATSGGAINLAMLLSGLSPVEMCDRWRALDLKELLSPLSLAEYLRSPGPAALIDSRTFRDKGFRALAIDIDRVRSATGVEATFNVCNFRRKTNEVVPHQQIDLDLLLAGMSLPGVFPPVRRDDALYLDSAFIKDANLMEAVRRGAQELWLVWCLGNTPEYRGGALYLYVQMLEMSANGALHDEFAQITEINARIRAGEAVGGRSAPIRLHLIKPAYPLPLDPELFTGAVDLATLIDMGYADAKSYLETAKDEGVPFEPETTQMKGEELGLTFRETMSGGFALGETEPEPGRRRGEKGGSELSLHATIRIQDLKKFVADPSHNGDITGHIDFTPFGENIPAKTGIFNLFSPTGQPRLKLMVYEIGFEHKGAEYYLAGRKEVRDDPGFDLWKDTTTLYTRLHKGRDKEGPVVGAGVLSLGVKELIKLVSTMRAVNADSAKEKAEAVAMFGKFFLGELWKSYADKLDL